MNKIETIRQKCIEANPSILDLKFGCEVDYKGKTYRCLGSTGMMTDIHQGCYSYFHFKEKGGFRVEQMHEDYDFEILGRHIRLADVLLALGLENFNNNDKIPELIYGYNHSWNLLEDDLTKQSPETIDFIYELIK